MTKDYQQSPRASSGRPLPVPPDAPKWAEPILEHDVGENPIRTAILAEPLTLDDGWMTIPDGPGLGIQVDEVAVRRLVA